MFKVKRFKSEKNGEYYFSICGMNGEIVSSSEGYKQVASRDKIADRLARLVEVEEVDYVKDGKIFKTEGIPNAIDLEYILGYADVVNVSEDGSYTLKSNLVTKESREYNFTVPNYKANQAMQIIPIFFESKLACYLTTQIIAFCRTRDVYCITDELISIINPDKILNHDLAGMIRNYDEYLEDKK